jgi:polysaccharide pyruvyl transferase WcaK-like protein
MSLPALLEEFLSSPTPESTMRAHTDAAIAELRASAASANGPGRRGDHPAAPLELLLVGYSGAGNVGADIRVAELVRQLRAIYGDASRLGLTLTTVGEHLPQRVLADVKTALVDSYMPTWLAERCAAADGVIACEGSMFKSTFSNALSMLMAGALGMASALGNPAVAYGAEAGEMTAELRDFVARNCADALVICRNERSREVLAPLGLRTALGADPAWTFEPASPARAEAILRAAGWDGAQPILAVCPINPFWWPVKADIGKAYALETTGAHRDHHYVSIFFHDDSEESAGRLEDYLQGLAGAVRAARRERGWFAIVVGMERIDRRACEALAEIAGEPLPVFVSGDLEPDELVALLRRSRLLVSSRYHALVTAMPAQVPGVGVSMDERIDTLLGELGRPDLRVGVDAPDLEERVLAAIAVLEEERGPVEAAVGRLVAAQLERLGRAGIVLAGELERLRPAARRRELPQTWEAHLPPLDGTLETLLADHA